MKPEKQAPVVDEATKISTVKQNTFTEFTVTMSKALEKVAAADFTMVRDNDNQVIQIKSVTLDEKDKTQVKLVVYSSLTDAKTYTVTYTAADEAKTQSTAKITVTDGVVADVAITPTEITVNSKTLIEYQTLDANGVIVSQKGAASKAEYNVDVTWDTLLGTMDNDTSEYIMYNVGDTTKFTVTYHTYKYDTTTGAEIGVITKDFTVTAVKNADVISQYTYTAATNHPYDWSKVTPKQAIAVNDTDRKAWFLIKDSKGKDVTDTCGYTVESSDNSIVVADGKIDTTTGVALNPVKQGSAYLMIKDTDGKVVNTLPITVGAKRTIATFMLSKTNVTIVTKAGIDAAIADTNAVSVGAICGYAELTVKDQYGDDIAVTIDPESKVTGSDIADLKVLEDNKTIRVTGNASNAGTGTGTYIITGTDALGKEARASLTVRSVDEPTGNPSYSVVFMTGSTKENAKAITSVDTTIYNSAKQSEYSTKPLDQKLTAVIVETKNGIVVRSVNDATKGIDEVKVTKTGETTPLLNVVSKAGVAKTTSCAAIGASVATIVTPAALSSGNEAKLEITARKVETSTNKVVSKYLEPGTYTVAFHIVGANNFSDTAKASFTVKDSQPAVTANVKVTDLGNNGGGNISSILLTPKYVEYYYGQVKSSAALAAADAPFIVSGKEVDYKKTNGDKNAFVTSVYVTVPVANTGYDMVVKVPINKTFVTTGSKWN